MTVPVLPVVVGTVAGAPIVAQTNNTAFTGVVNVVLSVDYHQLAPLGYPARPPSGTATPWYPQLISAGRTISVFLDEGAALVAAGAGSYA